MKKSIELIVTRHFDMDMEHAIGKLILYQDIPPNSVISFGFTLKKGKNGDKLEVCEAALITDAHYKNFLDAFPDSCIQAGGHIKGRGKKCQICKIII